jgi:hypothetical protein
MTLCPIALAVGCRKCPAFSICPHNTLIGDAPIPAEAPSGRTKPGARATRGPGKRSRR